MRNIRRFAIVLVSLICAICLLPLCAAAQEKAVTSVTVPVVLNHNRMLVDVEIQRSDGSWRAARLWVDTGNPSFYLTGRLARDLGIDLSAAHGNLEVPPPAGIRIGGMPLDFHDVQSVVMFRPRWLFGETHSDANLPSTVLARYDVVLDYPSMQLTIAKPASLEPRGERVPASINRETGIVQIDAVIDGDSLSFALDNGASYSFVDSLVLARTAERHPDRPRIIGAVGCANMWGWWPSDEQTLPVMRLSDIICGPVHLDGVGAVGVPRVAQFGPALGAWYSLNTARPVQGFLGPNAFKDYRVQIDYAGSAVYFEKGAEPAPPDMDIVGLTLRPEEDRSYTIIGVAVKDGKPVVEGIQPGDKLLLAEDIEATGATMGAVVDALRGKPGDVRTLIIERNGKQFMIDATVIRLL